MICLVNSRFGGLWHVLKDVSSFHKSLRIFSSFSPSILASSWLFKSKRFVYHFVFRNYVRSWGLGESRSLTEVLIGYWVHKQWANSSRRTGSTFRPRVASIEQIILGNLLAYLTWKKPLLMGCSHWSHILHTLSHFILTVIPWEKGRALKMLIYPRLRGY